jgi:hypothetical protein
VNKCKRKGHNLITSDLLVFSADMSALSFWEVGYFPEGEIRGSPVEYLASMRNYKQPASLEFRALISEGVEHLELVRTCVPLLKRRGAW